MIKFLILLKLKWVLSFQISELSKQIKGTLVSLSSLAAISDQEKIRKVTIIFIMNCQQRGTLYWGSHQCIFELRNSWHSFPPWCIWAYDPYYCFCLDLERLSSFGVNCLHSHPSLIITSRAESELRGSWVMVVIDLLQSRFPTALTTKKWYFLLLKWNWSEKFF